ncbi:MAG: lysylphosphatidylglycerol synthase transmembrane domain-containing protein [Candidatus Marinimicrobia bacterium]|nr:lysylphosphatidylglycerol synthase transmembrane domain-containing protein [Candidatus Neomarinimicrobiota bacterium]
MKHKVLRLSISIILSLAGLYIAFRGIEWSDFINELRSVNLLWYVGGMLGMILVIYIRAVRWRIFLLPIGRFPTLRLYKGTIAGFFTNYVLPFRMGEIVRAYVTGKFLDKKGTLLFPSIIIERFTDGVTFFFFVVIFSLFVKLPLSDKQILIVRVLLVALLLVFGIVIFVYYRLRHRISDFLDKKQGKLSNFFEDLHHGMLALFDIRYPFRILFFSFSLWFVTGLTYWAGIRALHLDLGFIEGFILMVTAMIAIAIPAAPGFVGTFHAAMVYALILLGIDKSTAASYAFLQHLIGLIPICTIGFAHFMEAHVRIKDLKSVHGTKS